MFEENNASSKKSFDFGATDNSPLKPIENQATEEKSGGKPTNTEKGAEAQENSQAQDSAVTDEKLFMESTGFGEPKHHTEDFTNSPKA